MKTPKVLFSDGKYSTGTEKSQPYKKEIMRIIRDHPKGRLLDIGCGSGLSSRMLKDEGINVVGLDVSQEAIKRYSKCGPTGMVCDVEQNLPFQDSVFDMIWVTEVIEHVVEYRQLLHEMNRILKPSGRIYLTTPNAVYYGYRAMYFLGRCPTELQHPYHVRFFSPRFLSAQLDAAGFEVDTMTGQNVYAMIPAWIIDNLDRKNSLLARGLHAFLMRLGFKRVEGLIHGDKYLYYTFSNTLNSLFSSVIMIVARKGRSPFRKRVA